MQPSKLKVPAIVTAVSAAGAFSFWLGGHSVRPTDYAAAVAAMPEATAKSGKDAHCTLAEAERQGTVDVALRGNGRDRMAIGIRNRSRQPLRIEIPAGQIFTSAESSVILLRTREIDLGVGETERHALETAAVRVGGRVGEAEFTLSDGSMPKLDVLLGYLNDHPEVATETAQTAVLALTDNLPVSAFAKFTPVGGEMQSIMDTTPFRTDVSNILNALLILRELKVPPGKLALTVDPQLRIEAMIDPDAHDLAMSYYGIATAREWEYWKWELTSGDEATRHYALFGIARFFPDVAIDMLPRWVREPRTNVVLRMAALQALVETDRPEALGILTQISLELGIDSDLGRMATQAVRNVSMRGREMEKTTAMTASYLTGEVGM